LAAEVVGAYEVAEMSSERVGAVDLIALDGGLPDGAVRSPDLAIGPRMLSILQGTAATSASRNPLAVTVLALLTGWTKADFEVWSIATKGWSLPSSVLASAMSTWLRHKRHRFERSAEGRLSRS
jgi:hypothetical protein